MKIIAIAALCVGFAALSCSDSGNNPQPVKYTLTTSATNGSVSLNPSGGSYTSGTVVTLAASPNSGYSFLIWSSDLTGAINPTMITMNANISATANFLADTQVFRAQDFKLSNNEISGWSNKIDTLDNSVTPPVVDTGWHVIPDVSSLRILIDGGASDYTVHGWLNGVQQKMEINRDGPQYEALIFNFGTADSATAMFRAKTPDTAYEKPNVIPGFDQSVAFGTNTIGGGTIFAHKNNLYFELAIVGYDSSAAAYSTAALFLNEYFNKMK